MGGELLTLTSVTCTGFREDSRVVATWQVAMRRRRRRVLADAEVEESAGADEKDVDARARQVIMRSPPDCHQISHDCHQCVIGSSSACGHPPSTCHPSSTWQEAREAADLAATLAEAAAEEAEAARVEEAEGRERDREAAAAEGIRLQVAYERWTASEAGRECASRREALPIGAIGRDILGALEKAQVCGMC